MQSNTTYMSFVNQSIGTGKSVYRRGADDGFWFGLYLSVLFLISVHSIYSAIAGIFAFAMAIAVPVIIFFFLRRSYRADNFTSSFSALWLHGICIFFFGSLIAALTTYIYLRFINPAYINTIVDMAIEVYGSVDTPDAHEMTTVLQRAKDAHLLPTAGGTAVQVIWAGVFTGSLLSMLLSAIIKATRRPNLPPPPPPAQFN